MKVVINAAAANMGGAVTYLTNLLPQLEAACAHGGQNNQFVLIAPTETLRRLPDSIDTPRFTRIEYREPPAQNRKRILFDQLEVPRIARQHGADLLFSQNGFGTFRAPCKEVLLVRNALYFSRLYVSRCRARGYPVRGVLQRRWWSVASIHFADRVLFPTAAMRDLVAPFVRVRDARSAVIHYGFSRETFFGHTEQVPEIAQQMQQWQRDGVRVLLSVSAFGFHKNFETLVAAIARLRNDECRVRLVLTIDRSRTEDLAAYDALMTQVRSLGVEDLVHNAGHVAYGALQHLYRQADVFVFPSFTESFGHSMVEAMASGLPSVAADVPVNREVLGGAALYFPTFDAESCAATIDSVLSDSNVAARLATHAAERAPAFSWSRYAEALLAEFDQLVAS